MKCIYNYKLYFIGNIIVLNILIKNDYEELYFKDYSGISKESFVMIFLIPSSHLPQVYLAYQRT